MKSQFIVVSLKDGMFNNANVLFKTKFVDGVSTVNRFMQSQSTKQGTDKTVLGRTGAGKEKAKAQARKNSAK